MKVLISFSEIQEIINKKIGKDVTLSRVDDKTINASCTIVIRIPVLGRIKKDITLDVSIEEIIGTDVHMTYNCGMAFGMMIAGALSFIKEDPRLSFVEIGDSRQITLKLDKMEKVKSVFDKVEIQSVNVTDSGVEAVCKLKDIL